MKTLLPTGWRRPKGYANGVMANGRVLMVSGMIGWDADERFHADDFAGQVRQALANVVAVLAEIGKHFRELIGHDDVAMTAVQVVARIEDRAKVEIEATAIVPA